MVKFAEVREGSVVQLGRFNKTRTDLSHAVGIVQSKQVCKIGNSTWSAIAVQVAENHVELVALHNIKGVLA